MIQTLRSMREELQKLAEPIEPQDYQPEPAPVKPPHPFITMGKHIGAFSLGTLAGYGGLHGANEISKRVGGSPIVSAPVAQLAIPAVLGLGNMIYQGWQGDMQRKMRDDSETRRSLRDSKKP
jgi:hypothetical protein